MKSEKEGMCMKAVKNSKLHTIIPSPQNFISFFLFFRFFLVPHFPSNLIKTIKFIFSFFLTSLKNDYEIRTQYTHTQINAHKIATKLFYTSRFLFLHSPEIIFYFWKAFYTKKKKWKNEIYRFHQCVSSLTLVDALLLCDGDEPLGLKR